MNIVYAIIILDADEDAIGPEIVGGWMTGLPRAEADKLPLLECMMMNVPPEPDDIEEAIEIARQAKAGLIENPERDLKLFDHDTPQWDD